MKAAILEKIKHPLLIKEFPLREELQAGEILIKLKAAALNHRDLWISEGAYAKIKLPCILGSDGAGIVERVGSPSAEYLLGKEVLINPNIDWGENERFQSLRYRLLGMPDNGTFAEYIIVSQDRVHLKPAHLDLAEAAALPLAGLTAYRALFTRGELKPGEKVFINGIGGGVARFAMQFALSVGAEVYVSSGSEEKIKQAEEKGVAEGINYKNKEAFKELFKKTGGMDLIIDSAGGEGFGNLITLAKFGGRIVFYGITAGFWNNIQAAPAFWKQLDIKGSTMGSDKEFAQMLRFVSKNKIKPEISRTFSLDEVNDALMYMKNQQQTGKIILNIQ